MRYSWTLKEDGKTVLGWMSAGDIADVVKLLWRNHPDAQVIYVEEASEDDEGDFVTMT